MSYEKIRFETEGELAFLTLNNPEKVNALSKKMIHEMIEVLTLLASDESIKVLIINAKGKNF